jgi:hypothetical protein
MKIYKLIAAFTTKSGSNSGGYLQTNLTEGQVYTFEFTLPDTTLGGSYIEPYDQIEDLKIYCTGWTWDVVIYFIGIY